jgi:hypothetical protein
LRRLLQRRTRRRLTTWMLCSRCEALLGRLLYVRQAPVPAQSQTTPLLQLWRSHISQRTLSTRCIGWSWAS